MTDKRRALGKGLSALIPDTPEPVRTGVTEIDIDLLAPNSQQPRLQIDDERLEELANSIRAHGVIQPIVVRASGASYRIIAGERRWRAAQRAGLHKVPVVVRDIEEGADQKLLEIALIENIQRENLNPIDEALAYHRLTEDFGMTQEQVAAAVGKERSSVANFLRLLKLTEEVRANLVSGALSMGHARAILGLSDEAAQRQAAREVIAGALSVRDTEALVKKLTAAPRERQASEPVAEPEKDVHTKAAEDRMRFSLGTKVHIKRRGPGGVIEIDFGSEAELHRLYEFITDNR